MPVTLKNKTPLVVPPAIQRRAGLSRADKLEFRARGGMITITAKPPSASEEYTPEQRRYIDARLAEAKKSPIHGPFTAAEAVRFLKKELKSRRRNARKPR
jgi:bifunctional DNA-binding transcriptional regulator/antitoxin component of YhaV-PrlF toxin-antitoxin module